MLAAHNQEVEDTDAAADDAGVASTGSGKPRQPPRDQAQQQPPASIEFPFAAVADFDRAFDHSDSANASSSSSAAALSVEAVELRELNATRHHASV